MTKKNTYYFIYNELQIVLGNLKMDTNHFFSDGYTHLSAQSCTNTTEHNEFSSNENQEGFERAMDIITSDIDSIDMDEELFEQSLKNGFGSLPQTDLCMPPPSAGANNILFQPKAEIVEDPTNTYHDMESKPYTQQQVEAWENPCIQETEAQDYAQFNEDRHSQNPDRNGSTTEIGGTKTPGDFRKYDESTKVRCKLCGEKYLYMHLESHIVGVHGLDGPREMYVDDQLDMARGSTVWPPAINDVEDPPFTGEMAAHNVPHEQELSVTDMMVDLEMQLPPPLPTRTETSPSKDKAGPVTPSSKILARNKWKIRGPDPKVICILCSKSGHCKRGCENSASSDENGLIPIPTVMDKNLYTFENPVKIRRKGPTKLKELLSFTLEPDYLCLGPKKSGIRAPSSGIVWLYGLVIQNEKYVIKWATCVDWAIETQRCLKLYPMREVDRAFEDTFLETSRQESLTRVEEKAKKMRDAAARENLEAELKMANDKLQQYDNVIKGFLMAIKTLRHIAIDQGKITDTNHRQYVSEKVRLANIVVALERTKNIASQEWDEYQGDPLDFFLNETS